MEFTAANPNQAQLWAAVGTFTVGALKSGASALDIASALRIHANQLEMNAASALTEQSTKKIKVARIADLPSNGHKEN